MRFHLMLHSFRTSSQESAPSLGAKHRVALLSSFSRGITKVSMWLLTVVVIPIIPCGGMDRKPVLHAHRYSMLEWMIVAIRIASI